MIRPVYAHTDHKTPSKNGVRFIADYKADHKLRSDKKANQWHIALKFQPKSGQRVILDTCVSPSTPDEIVINVFRQYGKSLTMRAVILDWLTEKDVVIGYCTPTNRLGREFYKKFDKMLSGTGLVKESNATDMQMELINGARLLFFSIESINTVRGFTLHYLIWDEVSHSREYLPDGNHCYYDVIAPMLDEKGRKKVFISTPNGASGFFYKKYREAIEKDDGRPKRWKCIKADSKDIRYIEVRIDEDETKSKEWVAKKKRSTPKLSYRQEYMCEFLEDGAGVFNGFNDLFTLSPDNALIDNAKEIWGGVDFSTDGADSTILTLISECGDVNQYLIEGDLDAKYAEIAEILNSCGTKLRRVLMEDNSIGLPMINEIKKKLTGWARSKVEAFHTSNTSKNEIITLLQYSVENGELHFTANNNALKEEMKVFALTTTKNGTKTYSAPEGYHDDRVMSLCFANKGYVEERNKGERKKIMVIRR